MRPAVDRATAWAAALPFSHLPLSLVSTDDPIADDIPGGRNKGGRGNSGGGVSWYMPLNDSSVEIQILYATTKWLVFETSICCFKI